MDSERQVSIDYKTAPKFWNSILSDFVHFRGTDAGYWNKYDEGKKKEYEKSATFTYESFYPS